MVGVSHAVAIRTVEINSLCDLIQTVTPAAPRPDSGRRRDSCVYRGSTYPETELLTSLDRLGTPEARPFSKGHLEAHMLRNFIRYARADLTTPPVNEFEFLILAQHHGLPTRLLDWSYSPMVAAHFATISQQPGDRVIWRLDWQRLHEHFELPAFALTVEDAAMALRRRGIESIWKLFDNDEFEPFVCMMEPPALDSRIIAQLATFTLSSTKRKSLDRKLAELGMENTLTRFTIPARSSSLIRDQLDLCGTDERRLFPGVDGLAAHLRRYYWSSPTEHMEN